MDDDDYNLTAADVAAHWGVTTETVLRHARARRLPGRCPTGTWRFRWKDVWRAEGRMPSGTCKVAIAERTAPLLNKRKVGARLKGGVRSVERHLADDLPKLRLPGGAVRVVPAELDRWIAAREEARRRRRVGGTAK